MEKLEPGLGQRILPELLADVIEVDVLEDDVFQVKPDGPHLRPGLEVLDDVLSDAT